FDWIGDGHAFLGESGSRCLDEHKKSPGVPAHDMPGAAPQGGSAVRPSAPAEALPLSISRYLVAILRSLALISASAHSLASFEKRSACLRKNSMRSMTRSFSRTGGSATGLSASDAWTELRPVIGVSY